jgi:general secretion pathway protein D
MHCLKPICTLMLATLLISGCTAGRAAFSSAEKLEREGNLDAAMVKYAEVAREHPDEGEYRVKFLKATEAAASAHFKKGEAFFALKNYEDALREYQSAYAIDPTRVQAGLMAEQALKLRNAQTFYLEGVEFERNHKPREAMVSYRHSLEFDPANRLAKQSLERLVEGKKQKLDGYELNLKSTKPITLKFRDAKLKEIFNILSQLSGINFVFDEAVKDTNVSLFLENATFQQAMEIITGMHKLDKKVLNESTIIIFPRTPDKLKQYEELFVQTFYLNKLDAKKAVNLIRTMLQVKKIYVNEEMNALVIRDTPEVIEVARKILEANDVPDAEVLLEVEVLELSKSNEETFGLALSKYGISAAVTSPGSNGQLLVDSLTQVTNNSTTTGTTTTTTAPTNLLNLFAYRGYNGYITVPNATFNFGKTLANGETLSNPKIRVKNREKAKFNVGTRVPITTTSSPSTGGINVNVQYVDVGVKVNAEPTIQINNEVSIKLSLEVSSILSSQTIGTDQATTVVTIGTRNLDTVLSLKDGETSIIGGLIQKQKTDSKSKIFLLGDIPLIGPLFSSTDDKNNKSELLLAITPRIVRGVTVPDNDVAAFWSGREDEPSATKPYSSFGEDAVTAPDTPSPIATATSGVPVVAGAVDDAPAVPARGALTAERRQRRSAAEAEGLAAAAAQAPAAAAATPAAAPALTPAARAAAPAPAAGTSAPAVAPAAPPASWPAAPAPALRAPAVVPQPVPVPAPPAPAPAPTSGVPAGAVPVAAAAVAAPPAPAPAAAAKAPAAAQPAAAPAAKAPAAAATATAPKRKMAPGNSKIALTVGVPASTALDNEFSVQVNASGVQNLYNAVFAVSYDPTKLDVVSQSDGPLLKQNGTTISFQAFADKKKGLIWVSASRLNAKEGASGSGALATVTFKAIGKGAAPVGLSNTLFTTRAGEQIPVTAFKSVVEVK